MPNIRIPNLQIFKEYDIRGIVQKDFSKDLIVALGKAFGTFVYQKTGKETPTIAVGQDVRLSSPELARNIEEGLLSSGSNVTSLGVCPTPVTYFSLFHLPLDAAVMITGSHNPKEYNGFKLCFNKTTLFGGEIQFLKKMILKNDFRSGSGKRDEYPILEAYQEFHLKRHRSLLSSERRLKVAVDAGNGTAALIIPYLLKKLGCDVIELFCNVDGNFPNHHPDPTIPENLQDLIKTVLYNKADLGLAFDGDADRLGVVDDTGRILWGDEIMVLLSRDILKRHPKAKIIGEVKCSQKMYQAISDAGGVPIMWKTGHSLIKNKMKEEHALLAGEMSGHLFLAEDYFGFDDAIHASLVICGILCNHFASGGKRLSEMLNDLPASYSTPEIRTECPDNLKFQMVEELKKQVESHVKLKKTPVIRDLITIDGVRPMFENGWGLVRASNTQPILVSRFEADSPENLETIRNFIESLVSKCNETCKP